MLNRLKVEGVEVPLVHAANSAAIVDCDDLKFDMVRAGIIMYGCYPSDDIMKERVPVEPVMTIKTRVSHIKTIEPGELVLRGYLLILLQPMKLTRALLKCRAKNSSIC